MPTMHILLMTLDIQLPAAQSLKEKRSSVRSMVDRLRTRYNVAVAEVDNHDKWQLATLAVITVSRLRARAEETSREVMDELETRFDIVVVGVSEEWL